MIKVTRLVYDKFKLRIQGRNQGLVLTKKLQGH